MKIDTARGMGRFRSGDDNSETLIELNWKHRHKTIWRCVVPDPVGVPADARGVEEWGLKKVGIPMGRIIGS